MLSKLLAGTSQPVDQVGEGHGITQSSKNANKVLRQVMKSYNSHYQELKF